jgi:hypothetical protein
MSRDALVGDGDVHHAIATGYMEMLLTKESQRVASEKLFFQALNEIGTLSDARARRHSEIRRFQPIRSLHYALPLQRSRMVTQADLDAHKKRFNENKRLFDQRGGGGVGVAPPASGPAPGRPPTPAPRPQGVVARPAPGPAPGSAPGSAPAPMGVAPPASGRPPAFAPRLVGVVGRPARGAPAQAPSLSESGLVRPLNKE